MKQFAIIFTDNEGDVVVGRCKTLDEAKRYLQNVRYISEYRRCTVSLDISEDGMCGSGHDNDGHFSYNIQPVY